MEVLFLSFLTLAVNVSGQLDALAALYAEKGSRYHTNRGLGGLQSWSGCFKNIIFCPCWESNFWVSNP